MGWKRWRSGRGAKPTGLKIMALENLALSSEAKLDQPDRRIAGLISIPAGRECL